MKRILDGLTAKQRYYQTAKGKASRSRDNARWYAKPENKQRSSEQSKAWRAANPDKMREYRDAWRENADNRAKELAAKAAYGNSPEGLARRAAQCSTRRVKLRGTAETLTVDDKDVLRSLRALTRVYREFADVDFHVDHITPVSKGGTNHSWNLQVLPALENMKKGAKCPPTSHGLMR